MPLGGGGWFFLVSYELGARRHRRPALLLASLFAWVLETLKKMRLHVQDQIRYIFYFWCILCILHSEGFMHNDEVEITYLGFSCFIRQVDSWRAVKMLLPGAPRSVLPMPAVFGGILDEAGERDLTFLVMRNPWLLRYLVLRDWGFNSTITCSIDKLASTIIL